MQTPFLNVEYIFNIIYTLIIQGKLLFQGSGDITQNASYQSIIQAWYIFSIFAAILALVFGAIIVYSLLRIRQIRAVEVEVYGGNASITNVEASSVSKENTQWEKVVTLSKSENENDWRQAILEADIMLGTMLASIGYEGESIAEQLKQVEPSDFQTLQHAWEAHKVRNRIAHDGSEFILTERDAREVISWFKVVFEEFSFI